MTITLDDTSPQFQFISATGNNTWITDHSGPNGDGAINAYFGSTFHSTHSEGDKMTLTFTGSGITIYGAKRENHGYYSTQLDNGNTAFVLGQSANDQFQKVLFQAGGLSVNKTHTVTLVNLPSMSSKNPADQWWLDIDFAVITVEIDHKIFTTTYDDSSTYVTYQGSGWGTGPPLEPANYYNTTAHITSEVGDAFSLKFNGSSIQLFGGLYTDHGNYTISLDGAGQGTYSGEAYQLFTGASLFAAASLEDGPHEILITNTGQGPNGTFFDFDYAVVNSTMDPQGRIGNSTGINSTDSSGGDSGDSDTTSSGSSNTGAIAGGVVGGVLGLALIAFLVWFFLRRRKRRDQHGGGGATPIDLTGDEVKPYPNDHNNRQTGHGDSGMNEASNAGEGGYATTLGISERQSLSDGQFLNNIPPPPPSNATSYPRSINPPSPVAYSGIPDDGHEFTNSFPPIAASSNGSYPSGHSDPSAPASSASAPRSNTSAQRTNAFAPPSTTFGLLSNQPGSTGTPSVAGSANDLPATPPAEQRTFKSPGVNLPFTARRPTVPTSYSTTTTGTDTMPTQSPPSRLQREGREMDMGPVPMSKEEEEDDVHGTLPPDYQQATEPLPGQPPEDRGVERV